jgi:CO/xanthine dehydrogenase Mo-binding subunit
MGFDGLIVIKPDGRLAVQSGIGNLGTESVFDVHRVAAELVGVPWEKVDVTWGNTSKNVPNTCGQGGSQTTHAMTRAAHAAGMDAVTKLQKIAAQALGGRPEDYEVANERVSRKGGGRGMSLADAARKAIELGGIYDGHELPTTINAFTKTSATALAGQGLMGVARDSYGRDGASKSYVAGFAEVEVDVETGAYRVIDYVAVADVGTVIHPRSLQGQINGGVMLGLGHAIGQKWVYDKQYGAPVARRFYQTRPPTILDAPHLQAEALDIADPETPVGARGVGEAPVGAGFGAVVNALAAAVGDEVFRRAPVTADVILAALEAGRPMHDPLTANV